LLSLLEHGPQRTKLKAILGTHWVFRYHAC
jgi:hypothetical protein